MNYTELVAAIKSYTENEYPTVDVNLFIEQAEQRIFNSVQIPDLRKNVTGNITLGNKYLNVPSDWLATFSLAVIDSNNVYTYLLNKDVNFIRQSFPDIDATFRKKPEYYAIFDDTTFILGATPDAAYTAELHYYYYPQSIVAAGTSWLGDNFDSTLLYGSLLEAATYLKADADTITNYMTRYNEAMDLIQNLGEGKNRRDAYRSGQARIPVKGSRGPI
tara:strand:- start:4910 stop:5563 length:654 start_codon:yes stop_codon:yes gene_type:complete